MTRYFGDLVGDAAYDALRDHAYEAVRLLVCFAEGDRLASHELDDCPKLMGGWCTGCNFRRRVDAVLSRRAVAQHFQTEAKREELGRLVRKVWIEWARTQPNPKPSWLKPWSELTDPEREVDRLIGERLFEAGLRAGEMRRANKR